MGSNSPFLVEPCDDFDVWDFRLVATGLPVDSSEPRSVDFAEGIYFALPTKSLSGATDTGSEQLETYLSEPHNESRPRGRTRSMTRALSETSSAVVIAQSRSLQNKRGMMCDRLDF